MAEFTANIHDGRGPVQTNGLRDYRVRRRVALVVITGMMTVFWTGASIGWGPMQLLLEGDGAFEDQCTEYEPRPCPAQTTKLLNVNFYAQLTLILSPVFGIFMDLYGPLCMTTLSTVFLIAGFGGVILAVARDIDVLLYISFFFVSMMTMTTYQSIIQVGMLFRGKTQQRVISLMNALLDSGTLTYLGLWAIQDASGVRLDFLISAYLLAGTCVFGAAMYLWHVVVPVSAGANDNNEETTEEPKLVANAEEREGNIDREGGPMPKGANFTIAETKSLNDNLYLRIGDPEIKVNTKKSKDDGQDVAIPPNDSTTVDNAVAPNDGYGEDGDGNHVLVSELSILQQLISKQFLLLLVFYTFYSCFNVYALGTARDFLAYLGDDETGNLYLSLFVLMTPVSLLGLPFMDYIVNRYGYHAGLQSINVLALSYSIVKVSSANLNVQVLGFVLFSMFRCFLFTVCFSFLPTFMMGKVVGRGVGVMVLCQGVTSLLNIPLASWAVNRLDGNFFLPNLLYTILIMPFFYVAWLMGAGIMIEKRSNAS